jgi:hypothetical protein
MRPEPTTPKITANDLRAALATRHGAVVQDAANGMVFPMPRGLTKLQMQDPNLIVLLTNDEATFFVEGAAGSYGQAARNATTVLRFEMDTVDRMLAVQK